MPEVVKASLGRINDHEFVRSLRCLKDNIESIDLAKNLIAERNKAMSAAVKSFGIILFGCIWLTNRGSDDYLAISFMSLSIKLPVAYVLFILSWFMFGVVTNIANYTMLFRQIVILAKKNFGSDNQGFLFSFIDGSSIGYAGLGVQARYIESGRLHKIMPSLYYIWLALPVAILLIFTTSVMIYETIIMIIFNSKYAYSRLISIVTLMFIICSTISVFIFFVNYKFNKNVSYIRWIVLKKIHDRYDYNFNYRRWLKGE